ncbi:MAG: uridine kinase [Candidatus Cloacimonadota bacterium]|nr:MAG: uridine kinase [Candidatus Cloacimonadota bacterium]
MTPKPIIIGIAGGSASGKTTVTKKILESLDSKEFSYFSHDSYYKDLFQHDEKDPAKINFDHPNSLETSLLEQQLIDITNGKTIQQPIYDFASHRRQENTISVSPAPIIIVEGILVFHSETIRNLMDIKIFVDTDADERLIRRLKRDILERGRELDKILQRYQETVKPMHQRFVEPTKVWADIIIPRGGENNIAINMVIQKIHFLINEFHKNKEKTLEA